VLSLTGRCVLLTRSALSLHHSHPATLHCTPCKPCDVRLSSVNVADPLCPPTIQSCPNHTQITQSHPGTLPHPLAPSCTLSHPVAPQVSHMTPGFNVAKPLPRPLPTHHSIMPCSTPSYPCTVLHCSAPRCTCLHFATPQVSPMTPGFDIADPLPPGTYILFEVSPCCTLPHPSAPSCTLLHLITPSHSQGKPHDTQFQCC
jgi:hypothetical protein